MRMWKKGKKRKNESRKMSKKNEQNVQIKSKKILENPRLNKRRLQNIDQWIIYLNKEVSDNKKSTIELLTVTNENVDNIQHNYELIYELKDQFEDLKQEVNALKLLQIISLKKEKETIIKQSKK